MRVEDFDYELPEELIAQVPLTARDASRLMVLTRSEHLVEHRHFRDLPEYLRPGDVLVLNDTRVIPARLAATRSTGGKVEILLLTPRGGDVWECLARPGRRAQVGQTLTFAGGRMTGLVLGKTEYGGRVLRPTPGPQAFRWCRARTSRASSPNLCAANRSGSNSTIRKKWQLRSCGR